MRQMAKHLALIVYLEAYDMWVVGEKYPNNTCLPWMYPTSINNVGNIYSTS